MIPVILSGGSGTRLWPVSRASYPKQFCEFYDQNFLKNTIRRIRKFGDPYVLTVDSMRSLTLRSMREEGLSADYGIFEPMGKNTAPAVALLCHHLNSKGRGDEVVGVFPADQLVTRAAEFLRILDVAEICAKKGEVVTLGIPPRFPSTGFGYLEVSQDVCESKGDIRAFYMTGFREKPNQATAEKFMDSGVHFWNAGIFVFKVSVMIDHLKKFTPEIWNKVSTIMVDGSNASYVYSTLQNISLDYAVMEKLPRAVCIPADVGWSDVGSWDELARLENENPEFKVESTAHVFSVESDGNFVFSVKPKVIGLVGVHDLIVVDTPDAIMIAQKGESQKVKNLVDEIRQNDSHVVTEHTFEYRPWGGFEVLAEAKEFKAKTISVDPGQQLSYQSHSHRAEHWIVVQGEAEIILDDKAHARKAGEYIFIPKGSKHRIRNVGKGPLKFIEVQTGDYFGEDDIIRYQDDYNRV